MSKKLLNQFKTERKSIDERFAMGKALRAKHPRIKQGVYKAAHDRPDPVSTLVAQGRTRLTELVPIRYARMLTSPFAFLRGAAAIMARDLSRSAPTTGITVQACGDMHVANFGVFASAERNLVFGINDFDETLPGPWEWDLKRLAASIVSASRYLGLDKALCEEGVVGATSSYRKRMKKYAAMGNMELWYSSIKEADILATLTAKQRATWKRLTEKARQRTHTQVLDKLTDIVDDKYRLRENAPFIVRETHTKAGRTIDEALGLLLSSYLPTLAEDRRTLLEHYRIVDVARKVVGVGSVGTRCWIIFLAGNHSNDPLFLQVKEAQQSVLEPYLPKSHYASNGQRVVAGQRLIQGAPDIFLGWGEQDGFHFYIRQLRDMKGGAEFNPDTFKAQNLIPYCTLCGWALALAHARSGDAAQIAGYAGNSDELDVAMVRFATAYAAQTERDHKALAAAAKSRRIKVARSA